MSALLPEGYSLGDAPWTLLEAIVFGLHFLGFEEYERDERPPKRIWFDTDALEEHWADVSRKRKEKFNLDGEKGIEGDVSHNAAADQLIVG